MSVRLRRLRRLAIRLRRLALLPALALVGSCENSVSIVADVLAGTYTAAAFVVIQSGQPPYDVLANGGGLTIKINADSTTSGTLSLPAGLFTPEASSADMTGRITQQNDGTYRFVQNENTFIPLLSWQQFTDALVTTTFLVNTQFQIALKK